MAAIGPGDLELLAEELRDACVESLDTIPTYEPALDGAPERSFVSPGNPVYDWVGEEETGCCDQLAIVVAGITTDPTSPGGLAEGLKQKTALILAIPFEIHITRCVPNSVEPPPTTDLLEGASAQINADGWALTNHLFNMIRNGDLFDHCREVFWTGTRSINPSGGCGGFVMTLTVQLDGYQEP